MLKINSSRIVSRKCVCCDNLLDIKVYANPKNPDYLQPIIGYKSRIACSRKCHRLWQKSISWEDRIGVDRADEIRKTRSEQLKMDNPSTRPGGSEKASRGMKRYLKENPDARLGKNNPFYGCKHKAKTIEHWKTTKKGKWSYNKEQKVKQAQNTPKRENHPNWQGGISNGEYGQEFNRKLKDYIKESYNYRCQLCSITEVNLDVHHIDYDKKNNAVANLIPLCKKCHGKTNYNREEWKKLFERLQ